MSVGRILAVTPLLLVVAACAPSPFGGTMSQRSVSDNSRSASLGAPRRLAALTPAPHPVRPQNTSNGLASFYDDEGTLTANGETFNPSAMTAAHPSLPFGTKLRVTNVTNGRSVVVRINDRGPFVPGRVVDVSVAAAEKLGMTEPGTAKVKLDVVH
jgi:rare lipoprotein A